MYGPQMEDIMRRILLVSEVAILAEEMEYQSLFQERLRKKGTKSFNSNAIQSGWLFNNVSIHGSSNHTEHDDNVENDDTYVYNIEEKLSAAENITEKPGGKSETPKIRSWLNYKLFSNSAEKAVNQIIDQKGESQNIEFVNLLGGSWDEPQGSSYSVRGPNLLKLFILTNPSSNIFFLRCSEG